MIESLRAQSVTWAQLAPALEVRSRQSAERRCLSPRGDPSEHADTTRDRPTARPDHRAAAAARVAIELPHGHRPPAPMRQPGSTTTAWNATPTASPS
ncbi:hypothetical protein [Nonomuraea endophytica]|uniref:Uncharacterized protein n=1 Tax=Nonomuraea endophytica TaxID=714136 RepID=A0A7W8AA92_9ACTN|nr:hypothetical protein [Nonomuraea endophytica]MBB5081530.1 hypothetical protein [Nonomuraea endophytica]